MNVLSLKAKCLRAAYCRDVDFQTIDDHFMNLTDNLFALRLNMKAIGDALSKDNPVNHDNILRVYSDAKDALKMSAESIDSIKERIFGESVNEQ